MSGTDKRPASFILRYLSGLRFPWLFAAAITLFGLDLLLPDLIPFADELLLGMLTLLLGAWRKRKDDRKEKLITIDAEKASLSSDETAKNNAIDVEYEVKRI